MGLFRQCPEVEIAAVCDVYELRRTQARKLALQAREYGDYRKVIEQKDIDAVVIAPPDHWHTPMALAAIGAGKDIYLEKPVTHTLEEGRRLQAAVEGSKRVVQTGTQNRSMPHFVQAKEMVASGVLGQVTFVETYFYQNYARNKPPGGPFDTSKLDWRGFLGPAPDQPFDRGRFQQWRWYWDFGGGALTDLFTHVVDVAHWFLGKDLAVSASASGSKTLIPRWETPDTVNASFEYPGGLLVAFHAMMGGSLQGGGTVFRGTKAMLRISRSGFELWDEPDQFIGPPTVPPRMEVKSQEDSVMFHVRNFLDCVRSRKTPNAPVAAGIACARAGHLGNMALRQGRKVAGTA
jgi:predicted dehydrogenase